MKKVLNSIKSFFINLGNSIKKGYNVTIKSIKNFIINLINYIKTHRVISILILLGIIIYIVGILLIGFIIPTVAILFIGGITFMAKKLKKKKVPFKSVLKVALIVIFSMAIVGLISATGFILYIVKTSPEFDPEKLYNKESSFLYTIDGEEFAKLGSEFRRIITYDEMSESLIDAIVAAEDSRFFQHNGVDLPRFLKASFSQLLGKGGGGASTLTMQVSKNKLTSSEDSGIEGIIRKFSDIYNSVFKIEPQYTKEQIIEFYANSNYLGGNASGVEEASLTYFNKSAKDLNIAESAMIAGLFQAPVGYDPFIYPEDCEDRRQTILYLMLRHGYITEEEYDIAKELTVDKILANKENPNIDNKYQDFINTVVEEVIDRTGNNPYEVPMKVYTTMNLKVQDSVTNIMTGKTFEWENDKVQAGTVILNVKTGEITAVGGSRNTVVRGDNYAVNLKNQIGSTAKPLYEYGPALEFYNYNTYSPVADEHYYYSSGVEIKNWNGRYSYLIPLQDAIVDSRNTTALKTFQKVNGKQTLEFVTNMGLSPEVEDGYMHEAHALGGYNGESPLTLAAAYAVFANGGYYIEPHSFTTIEYSDTDEIYEVKPITRKVLSAETAYLMTKMLEATAPDAAGNVNGVTFAAKTGTTNFDSDTLEVWDYPSTAVSNKWVASYNDQYAVTVWYGYTSLTEDYYLTTTNYEVKAVLRAVAKNVYKENAKWNKPNSIVEVVMENATDKYANPNIVLAGPNTPDELKYTAYYRKGFEPTEVSTRFNNLANVTNINYNEETKSLTWDAVPLNDYFNEEYLTNIYNSYFTNKSDLKEQIKKLVEYNNTKIGKIIYDIYVKDKDNNLQLIGSTEELSFNYPVAETTTFVIKTNYTILKTCESTGAEFTMTIVPIVITSELNGEATINLNVGSTYTDTNPVIVLENGTTNVTPQAAVTTTIVRLSDNTTVTNIETNKAESYTITYNIVYKDYTATHVKTINIVDTQTNN